MPEETVPVQAQDNGRKEALEMAPHPATNSNCVRDPEQELPEPGYPPAPTMGNDKNTIVLSQQNFGVIPYMAIQLTKINPHPNLKLNAESPCTELERGALNLLALGIIWDRSETAHEKTSGHLHLGMTV